MPDNDDSLGDQNTFDGSSKPADRGPQSLGDEATLGGDSGSDDGLFDDEMEVVDLESRYTTEGPLGKGGMGEVLLATDTRLNRKVAIKRILGSAARSKTAVSRFLTEAQSIAALNHPNIVQIYDYGRAKDGPFLIMEYVEGSSLLDRCREGAIPVEEAIELACQLCDGLEKAHAANIAHRDIKPANVLLTPDGVPKLTDFGLAKAETADTGMTMAGAVLGTLDFMPPEQRRDAAEVDARSDLWALAATFYQMVTGKSPKIIKFNDVPKSLHDVLGKALEDGKDNRYQTARDFRDALKASQLASADELELEEGDCPHCGTKNPSTRKFCRSCAESLEVPCLSCSTNMPMWEEVCDSCGAKQGELLEQSRKRMASNQSEAENLLKGLDFDGAKDLAVTLRDESDLRLQHLKTWADGFLPQIEKRREQEHLRIGGLLEEALAHQQAHDYAAGLRALQPIPSVLTETAVNGLTARDLRTELQSTLDEAKRLERVIREGVSKRKVDGLLPKIEKLQTIQPPREDLEKLHKQLTKRNLKLLTTGDEAFAEARKLYDLQDYRGCQKQIARIDPSLVSEEIRLLRDQATSNLNRLQELRDRISGSVKSQQLNGLLAVVLEALELESAAEDLQKLQRQLIEREKKATAAAKRQRTMVIRAGIGIATLVVVVVTVGAYLAIQSAAKVANIEKALDNGDYQTALRLDPANVEALSMKKAADIQKALEIGDFQAALQLDPTNTQALSMKKAADIQKALDSGDFQAALQLDPANVEALSMKRAADVKKALDSGDYQTALQLDSTNIQALSMRKAADVEKVKKALDSGDYQSALELDPTNRQALSMKKAADNIKKALDNGDYQTALQLDPANVEALSMKRAADVKKALDSGDYQTALELDPTNRQALSMKKAADIERIERTVLTLKEHTGSVRSVAFSPDGNTIVSGSSDNTIKIWDANTGKEKITLKGHTEDVLSVAFSPDGNSIVSGSYKTIKIWDANTGKEKRTLNGHTNWVLSVAFSPDGNSIVSGSNDKTLKIWDAKTGWEKLTLKGHINYVTSVAYSPYGNSIVSGSGEESLKIWDAKTGKEKLTLTGHTGSVWSVAYSPNGKSIVSGGYDDTLKIWDAKTGTEKLTLTGHAGGVNSVAYSPDGNSIVSGSDDDTLKIWDAKTGTEKLTLKGHTDSVASVAYSPDGNSIVSGSDDKTIKIWDVSAFSSR